MIIRQDLAAAWKQAVRAGQISNRFKDWQGRSVEVGIRIGVNGPEHYALDLKKGTEIGAEVVQRDIEGATLSVQWNQFRALKPQVRPKGLGRQTDYPPDAKECFFACQDPSNPLSLLRRRTSVHLSLPNYQWAAVYNAFPVEKDGHFMWLPISADGSVVAYPHHLQALTEPLFIDFLELGRAGTDTLTLFNSLHAGASVNHIHYHTVARKGGVPLDSASTKSTGHRRILDGYPASGVAYDEPITPRSAWLDIDKLQRQEIPLNLIYTKNRLHLFARNIDNEMIEEFPGGVMACMELSGRLITTEEPFYRNADRDLIQRAFSKITLGPEELLRALR